MLRRFLSVWVLSSLTLGAFVTAICAAALDGPEQLANADPNAMPVSVDQGAAELSRWLAALRTRASLLMVTAHSDDEDGGMLTAQMRGLGARAVLLTLTR